MGLDWIWGRTESWLAYAVRLREMVSLGIHHTPSTRSANLASRAVKTRSSTLCTGGTIICLAMANDATRVRAVSQT